MREVPAEMVGGHCGRNPALLTPKMESTSEIPGGPNLMCCCARLPDSRWRPGLDWKDIVVAIYHPSSPRCALAANATGGPHNLVRRDRLGIFSRRSGLGWKIIVIGESAGVPGNFANLPNQLCCNSGCPRARERTYKAKRSRGFTAECKKRIIAEADASTEPGAIGALLRREGPYSSQLTIWPPERTTGNESTF